jgi:flagellar hook-length control protein FliK
MGPIELNIAKLFQDPQGSGGGTGTSGLFELVLEGARRGSYAADYSQSDTDYDAAPRTREELNHRRDAEPLDLDRDDDARLAARGLDRDHDDGDAKPEPRPSAAHDRAEYEEDRPSSRSEAVEPRRGTSAENGAPTDETQDTDGTASATQEAVYGLANTPPDAAAPVSIPSEGASSQAIAPHAAAGGSVPTLNAAQAGSPAPTDILPKATPATVDAPLPSPGHATAGAALDPNGPGGQSVTPAAGASPASTANMRATQAAEGEPATPSASTSDLSARQSASTAGRDGGPAMAVTIAQSGVTDRPAGPLTAATGLATQQAAGQAVAAAPGQMKADNTGATPTSGDSAAGNAQGQPNGATAKQGQPNGGDGQNNPQASDRHGISTGEVKAPTGPTPDARAFNGFISVRPGVANQPDVGIVRGASALTPPAIALAGGATFAQGAMSTSSVAQGLEFTRPSATAGTPAQQVALQIHKASDGAISRLNLTLHPAELGRVEIKMETAENGILRAVISAERPEALELLARDARGLERALQDAGLKTDSQSLAFERQGANPGGDGRPGQDGERTAGHEENPADELGGEDEQLFDDGPRGGLPLGDGRVDISV